jgi:hypothetical protein
MGEDLDDYRRIFNGSDDLQATAAVGAVFDVDVEKWGPGSDRGNLLILHMKELKSGT